MTAVQCPACLYCHTRNDNHNQISCMTPLYKMREASEVNLQHWIDRCAKALAWWEKQASAVGGQHAGFPNPKPPARSRPGGLPAYDVAWAELLRAELGVASAVAGGCGQYIVEVKEQATGHPKGKGSPSLWLNALTHSPASAYCEPGQTSNSPP